MNSGKEVHGEIHSADASSGVEVTLYEAGTDTNALALGATEFLEITDIVVVSVAGGDVRVFFGSDMTPAAGSMIVRGTVGANGGIAKSFIVTPRGGVAGDTVRILAPIGVVDVNFTARLKTA